jgi:hypothetical protein
VRRRNWQYLARKLVDATDLDFSFNAVQAYMAANNLAFFGEGVLVTTTYPAPFPIALNQAMSGTVGNGIAYDPTGLQTRIDDGLATFQIQAADQNLDRLDLIVLTYQTKGEVQIPEPDLPTTTTFLNLDDYYQLSVVTGTPGQSTYPAKGPNDIILAGLSVPRGTNSGAGCSVDLSVREIATPLRTFYPQFKQEVPAGANDGTNSAFTLSALPLNPQSVIISVDGLSLHADQWSISGQVVTLNDVPPPASDIYAFYVVNVAGSVNPVSAVQEVPGGAIDGVNGYFTLSSTPVDQNSVQVFVDGLLVPTTLWALVQGPGQSAIQFTAGGIPDVGADIYAFYLKGAVANAQAEQGTSNGGGGATNFAVEYPTLSSNDISNGSITLTNVPINAKGVSLDVIGGSPQVYGADFTVSGQTVTFLPSLAGTLSVGDQLRVQYVY